MFLRRGDRADRAVAEFWRWWPSARVRIAESIGSPADGRCVIEELGARVQAIHPDLQWELGQGEVARHALVVSPGGVPAVRAVAARWRSAAPLADETWEFHDGRRRNPDFDGTSLQIDGRTLAMAQIRFGVITTGDEPHAIDVTVYHPLFAVLTEELRVRVTYLALDWALGEYGVEVWVGLIEPMCTPPPQARTVHELRQVVDDLADRHREPRWAMLSGQSASGDPVMAVVQSPLRSARWPRFDTHVALVLPYVDRGNGLPTDESLHALRSFEDRLDLLLGREGELVAHETSQGRRTLHYYVDGRGDLGKRLRRAASDWPNGTASSGHDPEFDLVRHLAR